MMFAQAAIPEIPSGFQLDWSGLCVDLAGLLLPAVGAVLGLYLGFLLFRAGLTWVSCLSDGSAHSTPDNSGGVLSENRNALDIDPANPPSTESLTLFAGGGPNGAGTWITRDDGELVWISFD